MDFQLKWIQKGEFLNENMQNAWQIFEGYFKNSKRLKARWISDKGFYVEFAGTIC